MGRNTYACSIAFACLSIAVAAIAQDSAWKVEITPLGPEPARLRKEVPTDDGRHLIWIAFTNDRQAVILDGKEDPAYPIIKSTPLVSPDGTRAAYKVDSPDGNKRMVVVDGKPGPIHENMSIASMRFSTDSRHLTYLAMDGTTSTVVRDGAPLKLDPPVQGGFWLSPDGAHMAWKSAAPAASGRRQMILNGKPCGPVVDQVLNTAVAFSPDGRRLAYVAQNGPEAASFKAKKSFVVIDGAAQPEYDKVEGLQFGPGGAGCVYIASEGGKQRVVSEGEPAPEYDAIDPHFLRFSSSGKRLGYRAQQAGGQALVVDGRETASGEGILDWGFSPDGKRFAMIVRMGERFAAIVDGKSGEPADAIAPPVAFSEDGTRFAYRARNAGRWRVIRDGKPGGEWDLIPGGPWFSPDGQKLAFFALRDGKWHAVVNDAATPCEWFAWGSLCFSPDSRSVAWKAREDDAWRVVLDGEAGPVFPRMPESGPAFLPDGSLDYLALRDGMLVRVRHAR